MNLSKTMNNKPSATKSIKIVASNINDQALVYALQNLPVAVLIFTNLKIVFLNKEAINIFKLSKLQQKNSSTISIFDFVLPQFTSSFKKLVLKLFKEKNTVQFVLKIKNFKNQIIDIEFKLNTITFNGKPAIQSIVTDITDKLILEKNVSNQKQNQNFSYNTKPAFSNIFEHTKLSKQTLRAQIAEDINKKLTVEINYRKKIQQELVTQTTKYEAIFNNTTHLIWSINKDFCITSFNKNYYDYLKRIFNYKITLGSNIKNIKTKTYQNENINLWIEKYNKVFNDTLNNKVEYFEVQNLDEKGKIHYREIYLHRIFGNNGQINEVAVIAQDVTERKFNEQKIIEQSAKLEAIFESGRQLIWTVDKNYIFTSFNQNFSNAMLRLYGVEPSLNKFYKPQKTKIGKQIHNWWINKYDEVFNKGLSIEFTTEQIDAVGKLIYRQVFIHPIIKNNTVQEISCMSNDVSDLRYLQDQSTNQAAKLNSIFESSSHLIWTVDKNFTTTSFNKNFSDSFKTYNGVAPKLNTQLHTLLSKNNKTSYKAFWYDIYKRVLEGNSLKIEREQPEANGEINVKEIYFNPIKNSNNEVIEVACLAHDITENKKFQQQIIEQSAKLTTIFESGDQLMWTINKDLKLSSFNKNFSNSIFVLYGYYPEIGKVISNTKSPEHHLFWDDKYKLALSGKQTEFIYERTLKNNTKIIRQIFLYPIKDKDGNVLEISGIGFDVTENKKNEEKITQSLKEKEVLLHEVHHRVKNNMQVISSILNLQSSYVKDEYALNLLKECQNRIKSMAFIHESLYQTKNFESVNFAEYITTLSKNLVHTYSINTKKIKLILTLDKLFLSLDASIPCGLIINEIISNSLKYAFPDNRDGIIFVNLKVVKRTIIIEVGDNGIGIPQNIDIKQTQTLGLQLVDTLVEQLNGTLILKRTKGTAFNIAFNI